MACIDLSEKINTYGISPLYELQIKGTTLTLRKTMLAMQIGDITIEDTAEGISVI